MKKVEIYKFIREYDRCILSTCSENKPQSALMGFGISDNLEFVFGTSTKTRKFKNINKQSKVSIVVGWNDSRSVQYEGNAQVLQGEELRKYKEIYFYQKPSARKLENLPDQVYFKVAPVWVRYTDVSDKPWRVFEINNF